VSVASDDVIMKLTPGVIVTYIGLGAVTVPRAVIVIEIADVAATLVVAIAADAPPTKVTVPLRVAAPVDAITTPPPAANVIVPVVSATVTAEFWISLPVVLSNLAIALSVELTGPTTSPVAPPVKPAHSAAPELLPVNIHIAPLATLGHRVPILYCPPTCGSKRSDVVGFL